MSWIADDILNPICTRIGYFVDIDAFEERTKVNIYFCQFQFCVENALLYGNIYQIQQLFGLLVFEQL